MHEPKGCANIRAMLPARRHPSAPGPAASLRGLRGLRSLCALFCLFLSLPAAAEPTEPASEATEAPPDNLDVHAVEASVEDAWREELLPDPEVMDFLALADAPVFLPRSYLYWGSPTGPKSDRQPLVFALEYALHLPAYNDLRRKALLGKKWAGAAMLSFEGNLRMLAQESKPVRMPSYRPSISGQVFYIWHRPHPILFGFRAGLFHYSNGQERCTFGGDEPDGSRACDIALEHVPDPAAELNRVSGNFATNGYLLEANARIHRLNRRGVALRHLAFGLGMAGNFRTGHAGFDPGLRRLYGFGPLYAQVEGRTVLGRGAMTLRARVTGYPDSGPTIPKASGEAQLVLAPVWLVGFGLFVRYYGGRDFYNAFFVDRIQQFAAGLSWDGERPLKFRKPK